jgi:hypothetical protein
VTHSGPREYQGPFIRLQGSRSVTFFKPTTPAICTVTHSTNSARTSALAASFHWNLVRLLGDISPTYHLAPPAADDRSTLAQLPYLNEALKLHVKTKSVRPDDWLEHATPALLAEIHSDCMASLLCAGSADVASTMLSNIGHTVVIRVILNTLHLAHRRTVDPAVLEEAISTLCLLSHRRYEGRIPELAICFGNSRRRPNRDEPAVHFGRQFLGSKKSSVLLKGGSLLLHCLGNGRVVEVVDLGFAPPSASGRALGPLAQIPILDYSYDRAALTVILTRQGEVLVAMGARICFSWDAASWRLYPAERLAEQLRVRFTHVCTGPGKALPGHPIHPSPASRLNPFKPRTRGWLGPTWVGRTLTVSSTSRAILDSK